MLRACLAVLFLIPVADEGASIPGPMDVPLVEERARLVEELNELARWCVKKRLGIERDRICRTILILDPEHESAHRRLKHVRRRGQWVAPRKPPTSRNAQARLVPDVRKRERELVDGYCLLRLRALDEEAEAWEREVSDEDLRELLRIAPGFEPARERLGETLGQSGTWVLVEGVHAKTRREAIFRIGADDLRAVPDPEVGAPAEWMRSVDLPWTGHRGTPRVIVSGTVPEEEIDRVTRIAHASQDFFNHVFSTKQSLPAGFRIVLLWRDADRDAFIDAFPGLSEKERERYRGTGGARFPVRPVVGEWLLDPRRRADGALRHCLGLLLEREYGLYTDHGWIWEGFGLCLTHRMIGTRLTYFIQHTDYVPESGAPLLRDLSTRPDWLRAALQMLEREQHPRLPSVVGKNVNQMSLDDVLYAHALAAYLLDGRPDAVDRVLRATGSGTHPVLALEQALDADARSIEDRLTRWLRETL